MKGRKGRAGLKGQLVEKSVDAYVLALETINRLSIKYRVESFTHLICNAWELLLKARVLDVLNLPLLDVPLSCSIMRPSIAVPRASFSQTASG